MNQIEKEKNGVQIFFHVLKKHFFTLVLLNLIFIVTCIPIITIGPACIAMAKVTMNMVQDKTNEAVRTYFVEFKMNFLKKAAIGSGITTVLVMMGYAVFINLRTPEIDMVTRVVVVIAIVVILYICASLMYVFKLLASIDLPSNEIWKNSFLLVFMSPKQMITLLILVVAPTILFVIFFSIGGLFLVIWHFSMSSLITSINAWVIIKKYVAVEYKDANKEKNENSEEKEK